MLPGAWSLEGMSLSEVLGLAMEWRIPLLCVAAFLVFLLLWMTDTLTPGAMIKNGRDIKPHTGLVWLTGAFLVMMCLMFAGSTFASQTWITGADPSSLRYRAAPSAGAYALTAAIALGLVQVVGRAAPKAGMGLAGMDLFSGIGCLLLALPLILLVSELAVIAHVGITGQQARPLAHTTLQQLSAKPDDPWRWALIAGAALGAPVVEEVIYRGFLQSAMLRMFGSPWVAITATSLAFALMHATGSQPVPYYALAPIFVLGMSMGLAFERTKRIGVPIVMHMGFNALNLYLAMRG